MSYTIESHQKLARLRDVAVCIGKARSAYHLVASVRDDLKQHNIPISEDLRAVLDELLGMGTLSRLEVLLDMTAEQAADDVLASDESG